jgi:hypothetical protein
MDLSLKPMILPLVTLLLLISSISLSQYSSSFPQVNDPKIVRIYQKFISLLNQTQSTELNNLAKKINNAWHSKKFDFISYPDTSYRTIANCMHTSVRVDSTMSITSIKLYYEPFYLALYRKYPSLAYAILTHELRHVSDAIHSESLFAISTTNLVEKYLFELDALVLESSYVRDIALPQKFKLTGFEKYLLACSNSDQIPGLSMALLSTDYVTITRIQEFSNLPSFETAWKTYLNFGDSLLTSFKVDTTNSEWDQYVSVMPLYTFYYYIGQNSFDILSHFEKEVKPSEFRIDKYPDLLQLRNSIRICLNQYTYLLNYQGRLVSSINRDIELRYP